MRSGVNAKDITCSRPIIRFLFQTMNSLFRAAKTCQNSDQGQRQEKISQDEPLNPAAFSESNHRQIGGGRHNFSVGSEILYPMIPQIW